MAVRRILQKDAVLVLVSADRHAGVSCANWSSAALLVLEKPTQDVDVL